MKIKRKVIFFVALMSLFYCISLMQSTYAKYISSASASTEITIARWNILINNADVTTNTSFTETIVPTFTGTSYISEGVIAPTSEGYFDIVVNGTNTDVSFKYTLSIAQGANNTVDDLVITGYDIDGVSQLYNDGDIIGIINNTDLTKVETLRFYVKWNDDSTTETMDNAADTEAASTGIAAFDINLNLLQLAE